MNSLLRLKQVHEEYVKDENISSDYQYILDLIEEVSIEYDTTKFSVFLSRNVVNLIAEKIKEFETEVVKIGRGGRTRKARRNPIESSIDVLKDLINNIFDVYGLNLQDNNHYKDYIDERNNKFLELEQILLIGCNDDLSLDVMMDIHGYNHEKIQKAGDELNNKLQRLNLIESNYDFARDKTIYVFNNTKLAIQEIDSLLVSNKNKYNSLENKLKTIREGDKFVNSELDIEINKKEYYSESLIQLSMKIGALEKHKNILINFYNQLKSRYSYLSQEGISPSKLTVFGDSNFEKVRDLAIGLKSLSFVSNQTDANDLLEVFMLDNSNASKPINLTNGTLNDFGYLMLKLRPHFVDSISVKSEYGLWWSKNFTFNTKEKSKKDVSNMITAIERGERFSEKIKSINELVDNLNPIPQ